MPMIWCAVVYILIALSATNVFAQHRCGNPPQLPMTQEERESTKGTLQGIAQFLSRLVGDAALSGAVELERRTIYQNAEAIASAQQDAYLAYIFCVITEGDTTVSTEEKLNALAEFKKPISINPTAVENREKKFDIVMSSPRQHPDPKCKLIKLKAVGNEITDGKDCYSWQVVSGIYNEHSMLVVFESIDERILAEESSKCYRKIKSFYVIDEDRIKLEAVYSMLPGCGRLESGVDEEQAFTIIQTDG